MTLPKNWRDPEIVTHDSFHAAVSPIREGWERQHAVGDNGCWGIGEAPFFVMLHELTGFSARTIRRCFNDQQNISLRVADEVLVALGRTDLFHQLDIRPRAALAA